MAVQVKREPAFTAADTSGDESSVTAVTYPDETPACSAHGQECSSCTLHPAAAGLHRTPEEILRLTAEDKFFQPCPTCSQYRVGRDVQLTFFDLRQGQACCSVCKHTHPADAVLQVRRSSYHDVVRVNEVTKIFDISQIQPYWINNDRVVFLRPRPQPRPPRGCSFPSSCQMCNRQLMDAHASFCSLQCKLRGAFGLSADNAPAPNAAATSTTSHKPAPKAHHQPQQLLPHWGKMRRRSLPHPESSGTGSDAKGLDNDVHTHGFSSDDEVEGGSVEKFQGLVSVMFSTGSGSSSSRKRKQPPCRSPFE